MFSVTRYSSKSFFLGAFLIFLLVLLLLPYQTEQFGLKKPNQEPKPKKTFPFHKISHIPIKEDDDLDEDVREFFEKVHHADIKSTAKPQAQTDDDEEEDDIEEDKRRLASGFFGWLFGSKKDDAAVEELESPPVINDEGEADQIGLDEKINSEAEKVEKQVDDKNNGIINWLQSLIPTGEIKKLPQQSIKESESIIVEYFNRWPFNVIFPIGKAQKIVVPKRNGGGKWIPGDPISDDDFETLLESFPSFIVNPNHVNDIDCKQQLQILQRQLRGHKLWTLHMLDSTGKIPSGILRGNINQIGDFDMCTNIKTSVKITKQVSVRIKGKYCLAHVEIQSANDDLKLAVHLSQGRGLWNSHLNDPLHFAPRYSIINWGICIPHACQSVIVRDMIDRSLQPYNHTGIYFHVEVNENDCYVRNSTRLRTLIKQNRNIGFTIGYFTIFLSAVISSIIIENRNIFKNIWRKLWNFLKPRIFKMQAEVKDFVELAKKSHAEAKAELETQIKKEVEKTENEVRKDEKSLAETDKAAEHEEKQKENEEEQKESDIKNEETNEENSEVILSESGEDAFDKSDSLLKEIILSFSPKRSIAMLFDKEGFDTVFALLHIIKIFCTFMLYVCLKYLMLGHLPVLNRDKLIKSLDTPLSIFYRSPIIYFDILLIISGFVKAHQMCHEMEEKFHIYALKRIILKVLRFLPTLYAVLLFQTWILPHLESGPLWNNIIGIQSQICEQSLWRNFFGVQNAISFEETCSPMTIQHSVELQLYLLAPLIVWLFYCNSDIGFMIYGGINMMSVAARYSRTNVEHLSSTLFHGIHISKFYRTANLLFSSPIPRATAFLIGIGGGILYKTSSNEWRDMSKIGLISGWLSAVASLIYCFWYPSAAVRSDYIYNSVDAASYASWSPLVLGFAIIWIIFMIPTRTIDERTTSLHRILTSQPILILSRITYPTQLIMYVAVLYFTAQQKVARPYSMNDLVDFSEISIILLHAIIVAIMIDIPMQRVTKLLINKILPDRPPSISATEEELVLSEELVSEEETSKDEMDKENEPELTESNTIEEYEAKEDFVAGGIWGADPEEEEKKYLARRKSSLQISNSNNSYSVEDIKSDDSKDKEKTVETKEKEAEEEVEEDEETEITEEEEIIKRPESPEKPPTPPPTTTQRRRRLN